MQNGRITHRCECLVAQRVLSVQVTQAEQNQRNNLFHTEGVVKEPSIRVIIDGGSCNNLASMEMVEKLSLTTRPHPHPYYIQWFNNSGKVSEKKLTRLGPKFSENALVENFSAILFLGASKRIDTVAVIESFF